MSIERCEICKEFIFSFQGKHKCDPLWMCGISEEEDDYCYEVYARTERCAAERCAREEEPNWDYSFIKNGGVNISVKNSETGEVKKFYVYAEHDILYSASEREDKT